MVPRKLDFRLKKDRALRKVVYERDNFKCILCGKEATEIPENYTGARTLRTKDGWLELDHIISRKNGGTNEPENLQTLCNKCNCSKGV